ncbi:hypothetical protein DFH07DRAFT_970115 [Mycena maculata]|uniref:Uncharacterized protein n=1 Tax=Mycena maculata TaxID=230809 RepID=A0AAD7HT38_9AGAR|nr:hypothetical protein DFH07DRAFT_970115 [Mycena maculata]
MEASAWDFTLAEEAELDRRAEEEEKDEDVRPAKRRRLMKRGSPEVDTRPPELLPFPPVPGSNRTAIRPKPVIPPISDQSL